MLWKAQPRPALPLFAMGSTKLEITETSSNCEKPVLLLFCYTTFAVTKKNVELEPPETKGNLSEPLLFPSCKTVPAISVNLFSWSKV